MNNSYQAVYDAVRSRIGQCAPHDALLDALRELNIGFYADCIRSEAVDTLRTYSAPSAVYRPALSIDGDHWCALHGSDLQSGVAGFGRSPAEAMADFDKAWFAPLPVSSNPRAAAYRYGSGPNGAHACPRCGAWCVCAEWYDGDACCHNIVAGCTLTPRDQVSTMHDAESENALDLAWRLIANASGGFWERESPEWQAAAARWRDTYYAPRMKRAAVEHALPREPT